MYKQEKNAKILQIAMQEILNTFNTPNIKLVSVMYVDLNANCGIAKFYISFISNQKGVDIIIELNEMRQQLRYMLGEKIKSKMRRVPEISFHNENFLERAFNMDRLIEEVVE